MSAVLIDDGPANEESPFLVRDAHPFDMKRWLEGPVQLLFGYAAPIVADLDHNLVGTIVGDDGNPSCPLDGRCVIA